MSKELLNKPDDPSKVTLFGRRQIGTADRPLISNVEFKKLIERLSEGDKSAWSEAKEKYSFESTQQRMINKYIL